MTPVWQPLRGNDLSGIVSARKRDKELEEVYHDNIKKLIT
jgi:hypothetical protein